MQLHDLMAKLFELRQVAADQAKDGPSGSGAMARALTAYEWLGDNIEAFVAGLDPEMTEGPASQTEGMGEDALRVDQGRNTRAESLPSVDDVAEVLFKKRQTSYFWEDAIEADAESDQGTLVSIVRDDAESVLKLFAALTPPETAEAVPVADEEAERAAFDAWWTQSGRKGAYDVLAGQAAYIAWRERASDPEAARLREELERVTRENATLREERHLADNALVDRYRDPKTGSFQFPTDVATIVRRLDATERERDDAVKALETARKGWRPIAPEDCEVATVQTFGTITLRNSHPAWVRDSDGRIYEAVWTVDDRGRSYWWDIEGESPVDPVEIYPHPLAARSAPSQGGERSAEDETLRADRDVLVVELAEAYRVISDARSCWWSFRQEAANCEGKVKDTWPELVRLDDKGRLVPRRFLGESDWAKTARDWCADAIQAREERDEAVRKAGRAAAEVVEWIRGEIPPFLTQAAMSNILAKASEVFPSPSE